jgi:glycosyltransferase involved in cell wall biosynthesis
VLYRPLEVWTFGILGNRAITRHPSVEAADIISLSWVSWFLDIEAIGQLLKKNKPVVWTCYDMWAFTGGCHYGGDCNNYIENCGKCPQLGSSKEQDISRRLWEKKKKCWDLSMLTMVCPSDWLAESVRNSGLLGDVRVEVIPTGIDASIFKQIPTETARKRLGLPLEKKLVLFIATTGFANERKGGRLLEKSLEKLYEMDQGEFPDVVVLGRRQAASSVAEKFTVHSREFDDDVSLANLYAACDVSVVPSKADNLPLTVLQSMACGTPCVAFDVGGMGDAIEHMTNGYLAQPFDLRDFAAGIDFVLSDAMRYDSLSVASINKIYSVFTSRHEAEQYLKLYEELLS